MAHDVQVQSAWHANGAQGLRVYCADCDRVLWASPEGGYETDMPESVVAGHQAEVRRNESQARKSRKDEEAREDGEVKDASIAGD